MDVSPEYGAPVNQTMANSRRPNSPGCSAPPRLGKLVWEGDPPRDYIRCDICISEADHETCRCPYLVLAKQLDVFKKSPPDRLNYTYCTKQEHKGTHGLGEFKGTHGLGYFFYDEPVDAERSATDAMRLQKGGMNMIRITNLSKDSRDPEQLQREFERIGPVAHVTVFADQGLGFANFLYEESAQRAIKDFNRSRLGHLMWATLSPDYA